MVRRLVFLLGLSLAILGMAASSFAQVEGGKAQAPKKAWNAPETPRVGGTPPVRVPRPGLFFREEWKNPRMVESPIAMDVVTNANLELNLYGSGKDMLMSGTTGDDLNPLHMMTGLCDRGCALTLRDKSNYVDLSGRAKLRWSTKVTGLQHLHPIVKLADGTWLIAENSDGDVAFADWNTTDFYFADTRWLSFDPDRVTGHGTWLTKVDLSKVDEIGWADIYPGSGHGTGGLSDVGALEVYGKAVARGTQVSKAQ